MLKIVVLALLVTFCHGQDNTTLLPSPTTTEDAMTMTISMDTAMNTTMNTTIADDVIPTTTADDAVATTTAVIMPETTSSMMATSSMSPLPTVTPSPDVIMFNGRRTYRDAAYYTALYRDGTYERTRPARLAHFNVSIVFGNFNV